MEKYSATPFDDVGSHFNQTFGDIANNYTFDCADSYGANPAIIFLRVVLYLVLLHISAIVVLGNMVVILTAIVEDLLNTRTYAFAVSLAVSDILIALIIIPVRGLWLVFGVWLFNDGFSKVWHALEFFTYAVSILNLCAIYLDRYLATIRPVPHNTAMLRAQVLIGTVYVSTSAMTIALLLSGKDSWLRHEPIRRYSTASHL